MWRSLGRILGALVLLGVGWAGAGRQAAAWQPAAGPAAAPATPAFGGPSQPDWAAPGQAGQLLVKLLAQSEVAAGSALGGARVLKMLPQLGLALVAAPAPELATSAADLVAQGLAQWAEPNYSMTPDQADYPNDPDYATYQSVYLDRLGMPQAWITSTGRAEIIVAVVDTGVAITHQDLQAGVWTNPGEIPGNDIDDDGNGFVDDVHGWNFVDDNNQLTDGMGHGTHVAGIAAARIGNAVGIAGMAGQATIMPVKVFPTASPYIGTYYDLIRAIVYAADNGARVINLSLGATSYSRGEEAAVDYAWSHGAVVVAAAGNDGSQNVYYPATHPHAIAVAATMGTGSSADTRAGFSNWGPWVALAAPGLDIYSTFPSSGGGTYRIMSGTSMAAPHVSGLAALILSVNPSLTPDEVRQALWDSGDPLTDSSWNLGGGQTYHPRRINASQALATVQPGPWPEPEPGPRLDPWPAGCVDLIPDGGFEGGLGGWQVQGAVEVTTAQAYSGTSSLRFIGGPNTRGVVSRTVTLPASAAQGTLWFAYRIETSDYGYGSGGSFPYADWMQAALRTSSGITITSLLRTGNTADNANGGLAWDEFSYRMQPADFVAPLLAGPQVSLVFSAGNDGNNQPTNFYLDAVRWCVVFDHTLWLPYLQR